MLKKSIRFFILGSFFLVPSCFVFAETKLEPNGLEIKADRLEQENTSNNTESTATDAFFNEATMDRYNEIKTRKEEKIKQEKEEFFLTPSKKVELYSATDFFTEPEEESLMQHESTAVATNETSTTNETKSALLLSGSGLGILLTGAAVSVSNYRKGV
ncbi:secretion protein EssA [Carnobacterium sp.]|uniref:secretion protein EssA n=1 Tax=Carnobacterium sp. TaxID=48221 RepID=UPI00257E76DD|nr:secretion protein EssA [Carnobacterium sp.]